MKIKSVIIKEEHFLLFYPTKTIQQMAIKVFKIMKITIGSITN